MAITKERLKELIEQGAAVYMIYGGVKTIELDSYSILIDDLLEIPDGDGDTDWYNIENLYEHKADAEWELEFGIVERTDKLILKKWNELNEYCKESDYYAIRFVANPFNVDVQYLFSVNLKSNGSIYICKEVDGGLSEVLFDKLFNKENYTEACRLIKKLFKGE